MSSIRVCVKKHSTRVCAPFNGHYREAHGQGKYGASRIRQNESMRGKSSMCIARFIKQKSIMLFDSPHNYCHDPLSYVSAKEQRGSPSILGAQATELPSMKSYSEANATSDILMVAPLPPPTPSSWPYTGCSYHMLWVSESIGLCVVSSSLIRYLCTVKPRLPPLRRINVSIDDSHVTDFFYPEAVAAPKFS